jgi:hypothetical protein
MSELQMRQIDRLPFIFAAILFLLAWLLGFPMRAQSAPLEDVQCTVILDAGSGKTDHQGGVFAGFLPRRQMPLLRSVPDGGVAACRLSRLSETPPQFPALPALR